MLAPRTSAGVRPDGGDGRRVPEQIRLRMDVRESLIAEEVDPYPPSFRPSRAIGELRLGMTASIAGRVLGVRDSAG